jgi:hypothetical protein
LLHLPFPLLLLGAGTWSGYRACDHDEFGFEFFVIAPLLLILALGMAVGSTALVTLAASPGRRALAASIHALLFVLAFCLLPKTGPLGRWIWEQRILAPRVAALKRFVPGAAEGTHRPVTIDGYTFDACERTPEGTLFYTLELGGPFPSFGIFVPIADDYRGFEPPEEGRPSKAACVTPTSVPGLFWFETKN